MHENPYVGPRAFAAGERLFGRDRELADLVDLVIAERIVLLHAPSGAGKSSLLHAGLIPRLRAEGLVPRPVARVGLPPPLTCADRFTLSVLLGLEEDVPKDRQTPLATLAQLRLVDYLDRRREGDEPEVLILDQFEELLTIDPGGRAAKLAFMRELGVALRRADRYAVLALREDWLAALDPYRGAIPTRLRTSYRLDLLGPAAALAAIQGPAAARGVRFAESAASKLIDDLRQIRVETPDGGVRVEPGPSVEPVQLQVTCRTLWSRLSPGTAEILPADLAAIGDVDHALAGFCDDVLVAVARACDTPERLLRAWLARHLVTDRGLRTQVLRGAGTSEGLDNRALAALVDAHLVRADERRGMTWYELAHDRLVAPLLASNARHAEAHLGPLERQAELWDRQARPESLLLAEPALLDRAAAEPGPRTPAELAFLAACQQLRRRRQRERRSVRFIAGLAVLACAGLVAASVAAVRARHSAARAEDMRGKAERERSEADSARAQAEAARQLALSRQLAAQAQTLPLVDYELAALLAVEASARAPAIEARGPLLGLAARWPRLRGLLDSDNEGAYGLAVDPQDGAAYVHFGALGLRKYGRGRVATALQRDPVSVLAFAAAGPLFAALGSESNVALRARKDGAVVRELGRPFAPADTGVAAALSPDGATLVVGSDRGELIAFKVADGRELWRVPGRPDLGGLVVTADAAFAVARTGIVRHDLADGHEIAALELPIARVASWPGRAVFAVLPPSSDPADGLLGPPQLVDMDTASIHRPVDRTPANYTAIALHPTGFDIAASVCEGECRSIELLVWDGRSAELRLRSSLGAVRPEAIVYEASGETVIVAAFDRLLRHDVRPPATVDPDTAAAVFLADDRLITAHATGLSRWTLDPLRRVDTIPWELNAADLRVTRDGRRAVIVTGEGRAVAYDLETRARQFDTPAPIAVTRAAIGELADGRLAVAGQDDSSNQIVAWDASSGAVLGRQRLPDGPFSDAGISWPEWSSDGHILTSTCLRSTFTCVEWRLWRWDPTHPDRPPEQPLPALAGQIDDFDTSPDGRALVVSAGGTLVRWSLPELRPLAVQRSDAAWGGSLAHGKDGSFIAAAGQCGDRPDCPGSGLQLLDAVTLQPIGAPQVIRDGPFFRVLAAGRDHVLTRSDLSVELWDLRLAQLQRSACELAARELAPDEWQRHLGDLPYRPICSELAAAP
ncbi:MAG: hypothetical protein IPO88_12545 [Nannocystis sp.]|uniref:nSTAND1 domain-containing NTPase n=1 Tax=Nannocystis sp. TaxID=1962667 RepID=UPI002429DB14|nr:hypothetical protein [Nannocystis sp.]MBK9754313.1 hypothetical protein [Nannocystis sp.]